MNKKIIVYLGIFILFSTLILNINDFDNVQAEEIKLELKDNDVFYYDIIVDADNQIEVNINAENNENEIYAVLYDPEGSYVDSGYTTGYYINLDEYNPIQGIYKLEIEGYDIQTTMENVSVSANYDIIELPYKTSYLDDNEVENYDIIVDADNQIEVNINAENNENEIYAVLYDPEGSYVDSGYTTGYYINLDEYNPIQGIYKLEIEGYDVVEEPEKILLTSNYFIKEIGEPSAFHEPLLFSPTNGEFITISKPALDWVQISGAIKYNIQINDVNNFKEPMVDTFVDWSSFETTESLDYGTYYWRVKSVYQSGESDWSKIYNFKINTGAVSLYSPLDESSVFTSQPRFDWSDLDGADGYEIQIDDYHSFKSPVVDTTSSESEHSLSSPLSGNTYYWRVRAIVSGEYTEWTDHWEFTIDTDSLTPSLLKPVKGTTLSDSTPFFDWETVSFADSYQIQIDDNYKFRSPDLESKTTDSEYTALDDLPDEKYYWRVRSIKDGVNGKWSEKWYFTLENPSINKVPSLYKPTDSDTVETSNPKFDWSSIIDADGYHIQIHTSNYFNSPIVDTTTEETTYTCSETLTPDRYYWRVRSVQQGVYSDWSETWEFDIEANNIPRPEVNKPERNSKISSNKPVFDWNPISDVDSYQIQVSTSQYFGSQIIIDEIVSKSEYKSTIDLEDDKYYWRVRVIKNGLNGEWSNARSFNIENELGSNSDYYDEVPATNTPGFEVLLVFSTLTFLVIMKRKKN